MVKSGFVNFTETEGAVNPNHSSAQQSNTQTEVMYRIDKDNIYHLSRLGSYLRLISSMYSPECKLILETLAINGMMTADQCVHSSLEYSVLTDNAPFDLEEEDLWKNFVFMIKEKLIMVKPPVVISERVNRTDEKYIRPDLRKRGGSFFSKKPFAHDMPVKKSKAMYLADTNLFEDIAANFEYVDDRTDPNNQESIFDTLTGKERVLNVGESNQVGAINKQDPMFTNQLSGENHVFVVNYRKIVHDIRTTTIVNIAKERVGKIHSQLIHVMLKKSNMYGRGVDIRHSEPLSLEEIVQGIPNTEKKRIDKNLIEKTLNEMGSDSLGFIRKNIICGYASEKISKYSVNLEKIIYIIQLKTIERVIQTKFGSPNHMRVFRALQILNIATDKQIEEVCLVSLKDSRAILMNLMRVGLVDQVELKTTKGLNYAYCLKISKFLRTFLEPMFKMKLNVVTKLKCLEKEQTELKEMTDLTFGKKDDLEKVEMQLKKFKIASNEIDEVILYFTQF